MIHAEIKALVSAVNIAAVTAGRQTAQKQKRQHKTWHLPTEKRVREGAVGAERMGSSISWCPTVVCLMDQSVRPYKGHHFRFCFSCCCCCFSCCCCCLCCAYFNWHFDCFAVRDFVLCAIHAFDCLTARGRGLGGGCLTSEGVDGGEVWSNCWSGALCADSPTVRSTVCCIVLRERARGRARELGGKPATAIWCGSNMLPEVVNISHWVRITKQKYNKCLID